MKPLKLSFLLMCAAGLFFAGAAIYQKNERKPSAVGEYTFAASYGKLLKNSKIVLDDGTNTFSLVMQDGNWRLLEKNAYFADYNIVNFVLSVIHHSKIKHYTGENDDDFEFLPEWKIAVFDGEKLLEQIAVMRKAEGLYVAKINNGKTIYELSGYFDFPHDYSIWMPQPLLVIKVKDVYRIEAQNDVLSRNLSNNDFEADDGTDIDVLSDALSELSFFDFSDVEKSESIKKKKNVKKFSVEAMSGLIYNFEVYEAKDRYFAEINLEAAMSSEKGIKDYVEKNRMLYDGWAFEISAERFEKFSRLK